MKKKKYLWVWSNVLVDWTSGIAFAIAPDYETAVKEIIKRGLIYDKGECLPKENCKRYPLTKNYANGVWGGG